MNNVTLLYAPKVVKREDASPPTIPERRSQTSRLSLETDSDYRGRRPRRLGQIAPTLGCLTKRRSRGRPSWRSFGPPVPCCFH